MAQTPTFPKLVSLACHDLRTPLATVSGFARTLTGRMELPDELLRPLSLIEAASEQLGDLLDDLGMLARIEGGRFQPQLAEIDTLELAAAVVESLAPGACEVAGEGGPVTVDVKVVTRALTNQARCVLRYGDLRHVELGAVAEGITLAPVPDAVGAVVLGDDLRDLGAAVARRVVEAHGGSVELRGETLYVEIGV